MSELIVPKAYQPKLTLYDTQTAIGILRHTFEKGLQDALHLKRVSAPLIVSPDTGINDDLNGIERPVSFDIKEDTSTGQIVHSLAKWKRMALYQYGFSVGEGLYTDMNAIRRDEVMDNLHSIYVDQWDWEQIIDSKDRNIDTLKEYVKKIVAFICDTQTAMKALYPTLTTTLSKDVSFITSQQLEDMYPSLTPKQREDAYLKKYKTAFIMQIGDVLASGNKHDGRAPDYDDWKLNGDILFWNETLQQAFEVSSMGIRVDKTALMEQLKKAGCEERMALPFHTLLLEDVLPSTIGGGIGQSRICMLLLEKAHIGEVQVSLWDDQTIKGCKEANIPLL